MDDLDHINALIDARGWEDLYVVNLLLEFVAKRGLRADLLAFLRRAEESENAVGIGPSKVKTP